MTRWGNSVSTEEVAHLTDKWIATLSSLVDVIAFLKSSVKPPNDTENLPSLFARIRKTMASLSIDVEVPGNLHFSLEQTELALQTKNMPHYSSSLMAFAILWKLLILKV